MTNRPNLLINPMLRWAVHPADQGRIAYIDGLAGAGVKVPDEDTVVTQPFLVDPQTRQPVQVRVVQVLERWDSQRSGHDICVVVTRAQ